VSASAGRREARERALGLLYEAEQKEISAAELLAALPVAPDPFASEILAGVDERRDEIDGLLGRYSERWTVDRMPALDRAVLRMATFELLSRPDVPTGVVLSEAVDLASQYSTDESGRFVNGLLARIAEDVRGPSHPAP
jgi:N utilization substance protein B